MSTIVRIHAWMMSRYFLINYLRISTIIAVRRYVLRILSLEFPLKEKKLNLSILTFDEPTNDQSSENKIQELLID